MKKLFKLLENNSFVLDTPDIDTLLKQSWKSLNADAVLFYITKKNNPASIHHETFEEFANSPEFKEWKSKHFARIAAIRAEMQKQKYSYKEKKQNI